MGGESKVHQQTNVPDHAGKEIFPLVTQISSIVFGFIGFILSATSIAGCHFFEISSSMLDLVFPVTASAGIFKYETITLGGLDNLFDYGFDYDYAYDYGYNFGDFNIRSGGCKAYPDSPRGITNYLDIDTPYQVAGFFSNNSSFRAARAFGAISALISGLLMVACLCMLFLRLPRWAFKTISGCYLFCFFSQLLTLLVLNNDICNGKLNDDLVKAYEMDLGINCSLSSGGASAIVASIFFLGIGILTLVCPTPKVHVISKTNFGDPMCGCCCKCEDEEFEPKQTTCHHSSEGNHIHCEMSTVTETFNPDGTVTIKEEKLNPDGSKVIKIVTKPADSVEI